MSDYKYTQAYAKIPSVLQKIVSTGKPTKVNKAWLETLGYRSTNDRPIIGVLKFVGFADDSGTPTPLWQEYRGGNQKAVLGNALRIVYKDLFEFYADPYQHSDADLENFFRQKTAGGAEVVRQLVGTFKSLCSQADFSTSLDGNTPAPPQPVISEEEQQSSKPSTAHVADSTDITPSVHIDIQIHISPESSTEQIDQIFASMAKHLYRKRSE